MVGERRVERARSEGTDLDEAALQEAAPREARSAWLETPVGRMVAVATESALLLLEFETRRGLDASLERLSLSYRVSAGRTTPLDSVERELRAYFAGQLREFRTPVALHGTEFQVAVWRALQNLPAGSTVSYGQLASQLGNPRSVRAVAQANGANRLAVIVPCHRVIEANGGLGGYGGGVETKRWLLEHERAAFGAPGRLF